MEKLRQVRRRFEEINHALQDAASLQDSTRYRDLMKEYHSLEPLVQAIQDYENAEAEYQEATQLLEEGDTDADLRQMARQQLADSRRQMEGTRQQIKLLLLPKDPRDDKNVILELRGGAGGEEAALFAHSLLRMYTMYAAARGWRTELLASSETGLGGIKEASLLVEGAGAYSRLKFESGVHRVQRVPETETQGRVHTSTVTVAVLPQADEVELEIDPKDLRIDTYRSSGAGGQHINKTESAIRITHLPTGMVVECQDERSQYKNKDKAMRVLRSRLLDLKVREQQGAIAAERKSQVGTGDRSERIRTYNFPQGRVTDHRIGLTLYKIDSFMDGALDEMIDALIADEQSRLLAGETAE